MKRLALIALAVLAACGEPAPKSGHVIDKDYTPAHWESGYRTEWRPVFRCRPESRYNAYTNQYESTTVCSTETEAYTVYESHHSFVNDRWRLRLEACDPPKNGNRKCHRGWRTVTETRYDRYDLGDFYTAEGE